MKTQKQVIGRRGEDEACCYLAGLGHRILRRNYRTSHLELDILSFCDNTLHVVEVKTRSGGSPLPPEVNVGSQKRRRMVSAAKAFMNSEERKALPKDIEVVFDVLTVVFEEPVPRIEYFPAAFVPIYSFHGISRFL